MTSLAHLRLILVIAGLLVVSLLLVQANVDAPPRRHPITVVVVRHAEKAAQPGSDPPLSEAGKARAQALAEALAGAHVDALFATQFRRTQDTLGPLAEARDLTINIRPVERDVETSARELAREIRALHAGAFAVVAGHSNTVPAILAALGVEDPPTLTEADYGGLFIVVCHEGSKSPDFINARYGAPEAPPLAAP